MKRSSHVQTITQMQQLDTSLPKNLLKSSPNLFLRLLLLVERSNDVCWNFNYELRAEPTALSDFTFWLDLSQVDLTSVKSVHFGLSTYLEHSSTKLRFKYVLRPYICT